MYPLQARGSKNPVITIVQQVVSKFSENNLIETVKSSKYDCACSHPEYQLVELKSGHQCVRPFLGFYTFDEAQMICNFDRSSILAPNNLEDAETFLDLASNGNDIWLPFKYFDVENYDMGYWKNYKSDQMATFLHFAPRNPDLGRGKLLQINQV